MCVLSTAVVFLAKMVDNTEIGQLVPAITPDSIETLLTIISASMLVIATFAVASMVSAYASASSTATPRSFSLVISDDVSQNALSTFIGAFIFSIVALIALKNGYYDKAGRFTLFVLTLMILAMVIITFVSWVDRIARLGRLGGTIDKVEAATAAALQRRRCAPTLRGVPAGRRQNGGQAIYGAGNWICTARRCHRAADVCGKIAGTNHGGRLARYFFCSGPGSCLCDRRLR